jgi:hypothetical protein
VNLVIDAVEYSTHSVVDSMGYSTALTRRRAMRARHGRAPLAPPPVASTLEPQDGEEVLDSGVVGFLPSRLPRGLDDWDRATGTGPESDEWMPTETAIATIPVGGRVHDITVSPDGEHV